MPRLSVWALRAALLHLLIGFTLGGLLLANKGMPFWPRVWATLPLHTEFLLIGWTVQLVLAVAFWILPRMPGGQRGKEPLAVLSLVCLNLGVLMAALQSLAMELLVAGRVLECLGGVLFALHAWQRIRPLVYKI